MHENMRYRMQENGFWKVSWTHIQERSSDSRVKHKKKIINVAGFDSVYDVLEDNYFWWWLIVFVVWLTNKRRLGLFPAGTTARNSHHGKSPTREQGLKLLSTVEYTTTPLHD